MVRPSSREYSTVKPDQFPGWPPSTQLTTTGTPAWIRGGSVAGKGTSRSGSTRVSLLRIVTESDAVPPRPSVTVSVKVRVVPAGSEARDERPVADHLSGVVGPAVGQPSPCRGRSHRRPDPRSPPSWRPCGQARRRPPASGCSAGFDSGGSRPGTAIRSARRSPFTSEVFSLVMFTEVRRRPVGTHAEERLSDVVQHQDGRCQEAAGAVACRALRCCRKGARRDRDPSRPSGCRPRCRVARRR